ncbi:hypothetical protein RHMOL_Rhmol11G0110700 [Rhododendron molle]|uniref:Uncharacterized protein n=1 Tax=Rhododendron molle TaxID=49168 RepID=A0ACC0LQW0_RHOML|nr:hypothetical protein RHMOL_Rhmol11G0110700 [Rhododendron molle]
MLTFENLFVNSFVLYQVSFLQVSLLKLRDLKDRKFMGQQGEHKGQVPVLECQAISGLNCYLCALLFVYQMLTFENLFVKSFVLYQVSFLRVGLLNICDFKDRKVIGTTRRAERNPSSTSINSPVNLDPLCYSKMFSLQARHVPVLKCQAISGLNWLPLCSHFLQVAFLQASLLKFRDFEDRKVMGTTKRAFRCRLYKLVC